MDSATLRCYSQNAHAVAQRYENVASPLASSFARVFPPGGRILDIGCGSGRDLAELHRQGYQAFGVDATPEFVDLAQETHPELTGNSLRHSSIMFRLLYGASIDTLKLARNARTSPEMIDRFYAAPLMGEMAIQELQAKRRPRPWER